VKSVVTSLTALYMCRLTIRIRSDDTIRLNTNTLFRALFGAEANTKRIFGISLIIIIIIRPGSWKINDVICVVLQGIAIKR